MAKANSSSGRSATSQRDRIQRTAVRLFATRGYAGTTVQAVADAVGISKQSLLYHFPSKDDLHASALSWATTNANQLVSRLLVAATSDGDHLTQALDELVAYFGEEPDYARFILRELIEAPERTHAAIHRVYQPWMTLVIEHVGRAQREGRIAADIDPESYVAAIGAMFMAIFALLEVPYHSPINPISPDVWRERWLREAVRVMRASLELRGAKPDR